MGQGFRDGIVHSDKIGRIKIHSVNPTVSVLSRANLERGDAMHNGSVIDELIESVQSAELHAFAGNSSAFERQMTRAQAYTEHLYDTWFNGHQAGVA